MANERKFTCAACGGEFIANWTEEDALAEKEANGWGGMDMSSMAQVCDDCYEEVMAVNNHKPGTRKGDQGK